MADTDNESDGGTIWDHARAYSNLLGTVPSSFTQAIRNLKLDADNNRPTSKAAAFQSARLAGSPTMSLGLTLVAQQYFLNEVQKRPGPLVGKDFIEIFPPETLAILFGISYFYKKAKKLADEEEWTHYTKNIHAHVDTCGFMGQAIPRIGLGRGLLVGAMDTVALTSFHLHDKKGFTEYRRTLKNKNLRQDLEYEFSRWGCTRYHVASILIQAMGFGVEFANSYATGMLGDEATEKLLPPASYTFYIARVWVDSLYKTGAAPDRPMRVEYYPEKSGLEEIIKKAKEFKKNGSPTSWLDKTKEETPENSGEGEGEEAS